MKQDLPEKVVVSLGSKGELVAAKARVGASHDDEAPVYVRLDVVRRMIEEAVGKFAWDVAREEQDPVADLLESIASAVETGMSGSDRFRGDAWILRANQRRAEVMTELLSDPRAIARATAELERIHADPANAAWLRAGSGKAAE